MPLESFELDVSFSTSWHELPSSFRDPRDSLVAEHTDRAIGRWTTWNAAPIRAIFKLSARSSSHQKSSASQLSSRLDPSQLGRRQKLLPNVPSVSRFTCLKVPVYHDCTRVLPRRAPVQFSTSPYFGFSLTPPCLTYTTRPTHYTPLDVRTASNRSAPQSRPLSSPLSIAPRRGRGPRPCHRYLYPAVTIR